MVNIEMALLNHLASWLGTRGPCNPLNEKAERLAGGQIESMPLRSVCQYLQDIADTYDALKRQQTAEELRATLDGASAVLPTALGRAWQRMERVASDLANSSSVRTEDVVQLTRACGLSLDLFSAFASGISVDTGMSGNSTHGSLTLTAALAQPSCIMQLASLVVQLQGVLQRLQICQLQAAVGLGQQPGQWQTFARTSAINTKPDHEHLLDSQTMLKRFMCKVRVWGAN